MATASYIGWWTVRPGGLWHLVESEVAERVITRCGRQLQQVREHGVLSFEPDPKGERCEQCTGRRVAD